MKYVYSIHCVFKRSIGGADRGETQAVVLFPTDGEFESTNDLARLEKIIQENLEKEALPGCGISDLAVISFQKLQNSGGTLERFEVRTRFGMK
jgi:hypothetical protein